MVAHDEHISGKFGDSHEGSPPPDSSFDAGHIGPANETSPFRFLPASTKIKEELITAVLLVPFTADGQILAVNHASRGIDIPGGHKEYTDRSDFGTARRELFEETGATVGHMAPCLIMESPPRENEDRNEPSYMMVMVGTIVDYGDFEPGEEILSRHFMDPDDFVSEYGGKFPNDMKFIVDAAIETVCDEQGQAPEFSPFTPDA